MYNLPFLQQTNICQNTNDGRPKIENCVVMPLMFSCGVLKVSVASCDYIKNQYTLYANTLNDLIERLGLGHEDKDKHDLNFFMAHLTNTVNGCASIKVNADSINLADILQTQMKGIKDVLAYMRGVAPIDDVNPLGGEFINLQGNWMLQSKYANLVPCFQTSVQITQISSWCSTDFFVQWILSTLGALFDIKKQKPGPPFCLCIPVPYEELPLYYDLFRGLMAPVTTLKPSNSRVMILLLPLSYKSDNPKKNLDLFLTDTIELTRILSDNSKRNYLRYII